MQRPGSRGISGVPVCVRKHATTDANPADNRGRKSREREREEEPNRGQKKKTTTRSKTMSAPKQNQKNKISQNIWGFFLFAMFSLLTPSSPRPAVVPILCPPPPPQDPHYASITTPPLLICLSVSPVSLYVQARTRAHISIARSNLQAGHERWNSVIC